MAITTGCGAEMAGFVEYHDPIYKEDMVMLVFAIGMLEVNNMKVPSLEAETLFFAKNVEIQSMTNEIAQKLWDRGTYCEPVPCATYYHLDNIEFNQVRFCEGAFDGSVGKNFLFLSKDFGCKFRMGQVILYKPPGMTFSSPETIDFCEDCTICVDACPSKALSIDDSIVCSRYFITHDHCSLCMDVCPVAKDS
jgi:ferredoxin